MKSAIAWSTVARGTRPTSPCTFQARLHRRRARIRMATAGPIDRVNGRLIESDADLLAQTEDHQATILAAEGSKNLSDTTWYMGFLIPPDRRLIRESIGWMPATSSDN